jgi:hypothetical protein
MFDISVQKGSRPHIRFETRSEEDRAASIEAGHKVYKDVNWVIVTPPGNKDVVEDRADEWMKKIRDRAQNGFYDPEWVESFSKMYGMFKDGKEMPEDGTPLRMCTTMFSPAEIDNCLSMHIRTLEQLANANEEALGRMGMGARALKLRAQESIQIGDGKGSAMKVEALTIQNAELQTTIRAQADKINDLAAIVNEMREQMAMQGETPRRGPGRPPKEQAA